jgi:hypothetical protein
LEKVDFEMDQSQRELRRAANQAFMESLNHLGMSLHVPDGKSKLAIPAEPPKPTLPVDLEDLEAAAADIESYMHTIQTQREAEATPTDESA